MNQIIECGAQGPYLKFLNTPNREAVRPMGAERRVDVTAEEDQEVPVAAARRSRPIVAAATHVGERPAAAVPIAGGRVTANTGTIVGECPAVTCIRASVPKR